MEIARWMETERLDHKISKRAWKQFSAERNLEMERNGSWLEAYHITCQTWRRQWYRWACVAASGYRSLAFIDDGDCWWMCTGLYSLLRFRKMLQNWSELHSTNGKWHKWKMTQSNSRVSEGEEMEDSSIAKPVSWSLTNRACFKVIKYKAKCKETHKQEATEGGWSPGQAAQGGKRQSTLHPSIKNNLHSTKI